MISPAIFRATAPTVSIDPQPIQSSSLTVGQVVKARVLERLSAEKSLIAISGVQMQAKTEIAVAPGDVLYFTVCSDEPLVLQLHGMEYRTINPFSTVESVVRLLNLTSDRLTIVILSHMMSRNQKISKSDVEENRRMITALRSEGLTEETDEDLLDIIYDLRSKRLPVTCAHVMLARKRVPSDDIGTLCAELLELMESEQLPDEVKDPIRRYFKKQQSALEALRSAVEMFGIDYEHSLVKWGIGSSDAAKTGSLKAALMNLLKHCEANGLPENLTGLHTATARLIDAIESQQFDALSPKEPNEFSLQIPVVLDGTLHTLSLSIIRHGSQGMFQDVPCEISFRMSIELSELGKVTASGRLAGRQLSAALSVDNEDHARMLENGFDRLTESLRTDGCVPVALSARKGISAVSLLRRAINASA
jgi:hypothetical protein